MNDTARPTAPRWPRLPLQRIVCGTDFSAPASHAEQRAAQLAREHGALLTLAHVVPTSLWDDASTRLADLFGADMPRSDALCDDALARLALLATRLKAEDGLHCEPEASVGRPASTLADRAEALDADLLVVADRGGNSLRQWVLGTTAQKLLRQSPCPVLVVKRDAARAYQTVLAPTDFSGPSRAALHAAATLLPKATLHIAHAFELPFDGMLRADIGPAAKRHYLDQAQRQLKRQLHDLVDQLGIAAARRALHVEHGYPATCIERWAAALRADLVVVAAYGKSGLERALLGSVSLHTAANASCDVLLMRGIE